MSFSETSESVCVILKWQLPHGYRAFILTLYCRTELLVEINWRAGIFQTVSMSRGLSKRFRSIPLASVHTVTGTTHTFLCCIYGFLIATNENAESHPDYVRAVLNKMWVDMWIIYVSKNKRYMLLLLCTKEQAHAQCKRVEVMQGLFYNYIKKNPYIHVYSIAQILHNLMYVLRMYILIMICLLNWITSASICLWKYEIWYCLIKSLHPLILPLSFFPSVGL